MSGVTGIYHLNGKEVDRNLLKRMTGAIAHRGPDDEGLFLSGHIGLGHRSLATADLSKAGRQPMVNEDGTLVIVHDGQVYNAPEIRRELEKAGYRFRSNSDTEVILHSYEKWGQECLGKFNGTWAFAIWNGQRNELFCAKDLLSSQFINPTFIRDNLDAWLGRQEADREGRRAAQEIWRCLNLELWLQVFFGNKTDKPL